MIRKLFAFVVALSTVLAISSRASATDIWLNVSNGSSHPASFSVDNIYSCVAPPTDSGGFNCQFSADCSGFVPLQGRICIPAALSTSAVHTVNVNTDGRTLSATVQLHYNPPQDSPFGPMSESYEASCNLLWFTDGPRFSCP